MCLMPFLNCLPFFIFLCQQQSEKLSEHQKKLNTESVTFEKMYEADEQPRGCGLQGGGNVDSKKKEKKQNTGTMPRPILRQSYPLCQSPPFSPLPAPTTHLVPMPHNASPQFYIPGTQNHEDWYHHHSHFSPPAIHPQPFQRGQFQYLPEGMAVHENSRSVGEPSGGQETTTTTTEEGMGNIESGGLGVGAGSAENPNNKKKVGNTDDEEQGNGGEESNRRKKQVQERSSR